MSVCENDGLALVLDAVTRVNDMKTSRRPARSFVLVLTSVCSPSCPHTWKP